MDRDELKRDAQDAERDDKWGVFKNGLDLYSEWNEYLYGLSKSELIELINYNDCVYDNSTDELDEWLRGVYDGKY